MFVAGLLSGKIAARVGSKPAVIAGSLSSTVGYLILAFSHSQSWEIYAASTILGIGLGLAFSAMSNLIVQAVPAAQTGIASGMNANIRTIGGAVGAGIMSSIVTSRLLGSGLPAQSGYTRGFAFLAACTIVATIAAFFIPKASRLPSGEDLEHNMHVEHAELALIAGGTISE
jgi:MFS family permease